MSILENLQSICKEHNISIPSLEKELGFGRGSMYKWDTNSPSIDKIQKVADYFKVSVDRILYGFELSRFEEMVRIVMNRRTCEQFAEDTGIDLETVEDIAMGLSIEQPNIETIFKIAEAIPNEYQVLVNKADLFRAAGYLAESYEREYETIMVAGEYPEDEKARLIEEYSKYETIAAHHDGEDWTEEELEEIEEFKEFVRMKRLKKGK